ncbi:MAG: glutamine synthetase, partial [Thermoplasmata archaeon]
MFVDLSGRLRSFYIPKDMKDELYNDGIEIDGYSINGYAHIDESDVIVKGLKEYYGPNTLDNMIVFSRILKDKSKHHPCDPIYVLERILEKYRHLGLEVRVGVEPEFYIVRSIEGHDLKPIDNASYMCASESRLVYKIRMKVAETLQDMGISIEKHHHEVGPGQCEINFRHSDPIETAMNFLILKIITKRIAINMGAMATFMPKPFSEYPGNGLHVHISLWKSDENAFYNSENVLSDLGLYFMGGVLEYAKPLTVFLAQTINSYRRLRPEFEAPVVISWGLSNRSTMIRIPEIASPEKRRIEIRTPDTAVNPFIAFAAILCAGLEGINKKIDPWEYKTDENIYAHKFSKDRLLPSSLEESLEFLEDHRDVFSYMGEFIDKFIEIKME